MPCTGMRLHHRHLMHPPPWNVHGHPQQQQNTELAMMTQATKVAAAAKILAVMMIIVLMTVSVI